MFSRCACCWSAVSERSVASAPAASTRARERRVHQGDVPDQLAGRAVGGLGREAIGERAVVDGQRRVGELDLGRAPEQRAGVDEQWFALRERSGSGPLDEGQDLVQAAAVRGHRERVGARDATRGGPQREAEQERG